MFLVILALAIGTVHFALPLAYYIHLKRHSSRPLNIRMSENYKPKVCVVLPTCNEVEIINQRLDNIKQQHYPEKLLELIVVDSSRDGTVEAIEAWSKTHQSFDLKLLRQSGRSGKLFALNLALKLVSADCGVIVFTDADVFWETKAISKAMSYLADPQVGCVTASISYIGNKGKIIGNVYRKYYNFVRVAESKFHSTPVHNGPFLAIKSQLVSKPGLPMFEGSDDSSFGSFIAFTGHRAVEVDDIMIGEQLRGSHILRKIRRAQHLLLNFHMTKKYAQKSGLYVKSSFDRIWKIEWWLHVVNPWLLILSTIFFVVDIALSRSLLRFAPMMLGATLLVLRSFRMWIFQQLCLAIGAVRNLWNKDTAWRK